MPIASLVVVSVVAAVLLIIPTVLVFMFFYTRGESTPVDVREAAIRRSPQCLPPSQAKREPRGPLPLIATSAETTS